MDLFSLVFFRFPTNSPNPNPNFQTLPFPANQTIPKYRIYLKRRKRHSLSLKAKKPRSETQLCFSSLSTKLGLLLLAIQFNVSVYPHPSHLHTPTKFLLFNKMSLIESDRNIVLVIQYSGLHLNCDKVSNVIRGSRGKKIGNIMGC